MAGVIVMLGSPALGGASEAGTPAPDRIDITTERLQLVFSSSAAAPILWRACHPSCVAADGGSGTSIRFTDAPRLRVTLAGAGPDAGLHSAPVTADVADTPSARVVTFTSAPIDGVRLVTAFDIARRGYDVTLAVRVVGTKAEAVMAGRRLMVTLETSPAWSPRATSGWLIIGNEVRRLIVNEDRVRLLGAEERGLLPLQARQWIGFRDRFWALLARGADGASADLSPGASLAVVLASAPGASSARYTLFSGPLEYHALSRADPELRSLLFSALWSWLRALSVGALLLLNALIAVVGHPGPAIILLAVAVKILLLPVTTIAHRLQAQVDEAQGRLQPEIEAIKAGYRGEARARRLLELYRQQRIHPLYTLKSLVGVLIQLPVFVAVFDMLAENFALNGASFLGIGDLAQPDGLIPLPVVVPAVGGRLNVLPFVMYGVSLASALRYDSAALSPDLLRRQRQKLAAMAALFFVLFYAFPAGMVLYWTSTNTLQLATRELSRLRARALPAPSMPGGRQ